MTASQKAEIVRLAEQKKFNKAKMLCKKLCKQAPNDPEAWFLYGSVNGAIEDFPAAEFCCRKALKFASQNYMLLFNLGIALIKQGKIEDAVIEFENTIKLQPQHADAYLELANSLNLIGDISGAMLNYKKALQLNPNSARAYYNLGELQSNLGELQEATNNYEHAIALQKEFVESYCGLASALIALFKFDKTIRLLETNIPHLPPKACLYFFLAVAYQEKGETEKANLYYNKTLEVDNHHINAQTGLAGILALQGDYKQAGILLENLLKVTPENSTVIITYITYAYQFDSINKALDIGIQHLNKKKLTDSTRSKLMFALAKLFEKQEDLDVAFEYYQQGNRLRGDSFDEQKHIDMFTNFANTYTAEFIKQYQRNDADIVNPIFIVGMPRSGTSLAEQILASHPDVYGAGELPTINHILQMLPGRIGAEKPYPECLDKLDMNTLNQLAAEYLNELTSKSGTEKYITDKMPLNAIHLGFISLLFPKAKIIHCKRDPRDTCLSCYFTNFSGEHSYAFSLKSLGKFYRMYEDQMKHWSNVIPNPIYELSYETIVDNPEKVIRSLLDFCGLEWDDACLNFHKTKRTVATASHDQVRQTVYSSSVERWRYYEKHLDELFTALGQ